MLQKNKIFLHLLGSFYDETANTDFSSRLDYIYTSIIFNRYTDVLRNTVLNVDSSAVPNSVNFGFVKPSEINPTTKEITIRDYNGVEIDDIDFISIMYLDIEEFYTVKDGITTNKAIEAISKYSSQSIPITYIKNVSLDIGRNGIFKFVDDITDFDYKKISDAALRIVSDQLVYYPETLKLLHKLSNILIGAIYSLNDETVLEVSSGLIVTNRNVYKLSGINYGRSIVSAGDIVTASSLLTQVATLNTDIAFISDVMKIESYINSISPSFSNTSFLNRISSAIAKKKAAVVIPPDVFSETDTEVISAVNSIFKLSTTMETHTTSGMFDSEDITASPASSWLIVYSANVEISMVGYWDLTIIADDFVVAGASSDEILLEDYQPTIVKENFLLGLEPLLDFTDGSFTDDAIYRIDSLSSVQGSSLDVPSGEYVDTVIATTDEDWAKIHEDSSLITSTDGGATYSDITVAIADTLGITESDVKTISARKAMEVFIGDSLTSISQFFESISMDYSLGGYIETIDASTISSSSNDFVMIADAQSIDIDEGDSSSKSTVKLETLFTMEDSSSYTGDQDDSMSILVDIDEKTILSAKEAILLLDESDVESENQIDS